MYRYCPICGHVHEVRTISKPLTEIINGVNVPYQGRVYFCQFRKAPNAENEYVSMLMRQENHEEALRIYEKMQNTSLDGKSVLAQMSAVDAIKKAVREKYNPKQTDLMQLNQI